MAFDTLTTHSKPHEINYTKPMLEQVGQLGKHYDEWVHCPKPRIHNFRMFQSDIAECFSTTPWYVIPLVWGPYTALLFLRALVLMSGKTSDLVTLGLSIIAGIIAWTLAEYVLHRFIFHTLSASTSPTLITLHFLLHGQHHKFPNDAGRLVFPIVPAMIVWTFFRLVFSVLLPPVLLPGFSVGFVFAYIVYDIIHFYIHHGHPSTAYISSLKTAHMHHHYNNPARGFGISSKIWDYPFRTLARKNNK
jgi:sterol desaturase/sphingolipid hydroxylase (fatty acid hydroxylase superfamily)